MNKANFRGNGAYDVSCPCFDKIDGTDVSLADIVVVDYPEADGDDPIILASLNGRGGVDSAAIEGGTMSLFYHWYDFGEDQPAGWYDHNGGAMVDQKTYDEGPYADLDIPLSELGDAKDVKFTTAKGFRVIKSASYKNAKLAINGQVVKTDTRVKDFRGNGAYDVVGNNTPVDLTLADLYVDPDTYPEADGDDPIILASLNGRGGVDSAAIEGGTMSLFYHWYDFGEDQPAGWYDHNGGAMVDQKTYDEGPYADLDIPLSELGDARNVILHPGDALRAIQSASYKNAKLFIPAPKGL